MIGLNNVIEIAIISIPMLLLSIVLPTFEMQKAYIGGVYTALLFVYSLKSD